MQVSTDTQRNVFPIVLRAAAARVAAFRTARMITDPDSEDFYSNEGDAKNFIKSCVESENIPVELDGRLLVRTDL